MSEELSATSSSATAEQNLDQDFFSTTDDQDENTTNNTNDTTPIIINYKDKSQDELNELLLQSSIDEDLNGIKLALEHGANASFNKMIDGVWGAYEQYGPIHKILEWRDDENRYLALELLLSKGGNVNDKYGSSNWKGSGSSGTAFEMVLQLNNLKLIKLFLEYGANPNTSQVHEAHTMRYDGRSSYPYLYQTIRYGNFELFKCLLQNNADTNVFAINRGQSEYGNIDNTKETPLHLACKLFKTINQNNIENDDENDDIDVNDQDNNNTENKFKEMILLLLQHNTNVNCYGHTVYQIPNEEFYALNLKEDSDEYYQVSDPRGDSFIPKIKNVFIKYTPIHLAIRNQNEELFNILMFNGANLNLNFIKNNQDLTTSELLKENNLNWRLQFEWSSQYHKYLPSELKNSIKTLQYCASYLNWPLNIDTLSIIYTFICLDYFYTNNSKYIENEQDDHPYY